MAGRALRMLLRVYQVALLVVVLVFIGDRVASGKVVALVLLVPVSILTLLARMITVREARIERNEGSDG